LPTLPSGAPLVGSRSLSRAARRGTRADRRRNRHAGRRANLGSPLQVSGARPDRTRPRSLGSRAPAGPGGGTASPDPAYGSNRPSASPPPALSATRIQSRGPSGPGDCSPARQPPGDALARACPRYPSPGRTRRSIPPTECLQRLCLPSATRTRRPKGLACGRCDHHRRDHCLRRSSPAQGRRSGGHGDLPCPDTSPEQRIRAERRGLWGRLGLPAANRLDNHFAQTDGVDGFLENHAFETLYPASLDDVVLVVVESSHHQHRQVRVAFA